MNCNRILNLTTSSLSPTPKEVERMSLVRCNNPLTDKELDVRVRTQLPARKEYGKEASASTSSHSRQGAVGQFAFDYSINLPAAHENLGVG